MFRGSYVLGNLRPLVLTFMGSYVQRELYWSVALFCAGVLTSVGSTFGGSHVHGF